MFLLLLWEVAVAAAVLAMRKPVLAVDLDGGIMYR
jgi:hypothetical protein